MDTQEGKWLDLVRKIAALQRSSQRILISDADLDLAVMIAPARLIHDGFGCIDTDAFQIDTLRQVSVEDSLHYEQAIRHIAAVSRAAIRASVYHELYNDVRDEVESYEAEEEQRRGYSFVSADL